jgi:3-dehydroquinate dehydratase-2
MAQILVVNGPNLNMLGSREPTVYGSLSLEEIKSQMIISAKHWQHQLSFVQSNIEGVLIDAIHQAKLSGIDFIIINPAAFGHTSIALRDALLAVQIPFIEVHLSNIYARESFRHHSYLADCAIGVISGFQALSYQLALQAAHHYLLQHKQA